MRLKLSVLRAVDQWFNNLGKRPALAVTVSILCLLLISWVAFGWNLGRISLIDETEPLFAEASRQMFVTGDWITPYFNGETRFDKPALIYWCQAIAYKMIGVNEWAVRLPSALTAMGLISFAFYTVYWHLAQKDELEQVTNLTRRYLTALVTAAVMAFSPEMIIWGRAGVSDMLLNGCMASALLCFFLGYANNSKFKIQNSKFPNQWYLASYVLTAGAILSKGPVGIVLPGLIIAGFLVYLGKVREVLREMRLLMGMLIILGISLPWYALVIWRNGWNYINAFFGYHNLERFTEVVNGHKGPWYFYFLVVLLGFAPYSVYLPAAMVRLKFWQRSHWRTQERSQQLGLFAWFWFVVVFGFFSIAVTKLPSYMLPLMPAAAILVALLWSDLFPDRETHRHGDHSFPPNAPLPQRPSPPSFFRVTGWVNIAFLSVLSVALFHLPQILGSDPAIPNLEQLIQQSGLTTYGSGIWLLCAIMVAVFLLNHRWRPIITINLLGFVAFLVIVLMPAVFLMDRERQIPLKELSAIASLAKQPHEELVMVGFKKPSVVFYTGSQVNYMKFSRDAVAHIQQQAAQKVQPPSLLILTEQKRLLQMDLPPDDYKSLSTKGAYQLIRVPLKKAKTEKMDISSSSSFINPLALIPGESQVEHS
ncbi:ArnT family glycosyltransferase [Cylindrospermum sp. FACHB-282]|uniref:ArnT family glycosyltransferase n=1 Tax=Cylindrospermum sp. FACHB-282 TaxID=2692794 RepID=UPI001688D26F|nr:glycosyltransferase family 39 protein [Cylindrospermum sp. FACHB-282]MBD2387276.1 glycosyltransferase family 39 protein [Cylindrospermum sp. FACHB-282]